MAIAADRELGIRFCKILGLDPIKVRGITLVVAPGDAVIAEVEIYPDEEDMRLIELELKRYKLVKKDD